MVTETFSVLSRGGHSDPLVSKIDGKAVDVVIPILINQELDKSSGNCFNNTSVEFWGAVVISGEQGNYHFTIIRQKSKC